MLKSSVENTFADPQEIKSHQKTLNLLLKAHQAYRRVYGEDPYFENPYSPLMREQASLLRSLRGLSEEPVFAQSADEDQLAQDAHSWINGNPIPDQTRPIPEPKTAPKEQPTPSPSQENDAHGWLMPQQHDQFPIINMRRTPGVNGDPDDWSPNTDDTTPPHDGPNPSGDPKPFSPRFGLPSEKLASAWASLTGTLYGCVKAARKSFTSLQSTLIRRAQNGMTKKKAPPYNEFIPAATGVGLGLYIMTHTPFLPLGIRALGTLAVLCGGLGLYIYRDLRRPRSSPTPS